MEDNSWKPRPSHLAESAYNSPYARASAPTPHPNTDPYAPLRAKALATLEAMGYDPQTMVERGVFWAEDQDPFGHVMQSQYMTFLGACFHRVMESYDEFLNEKEYNDMIIAKTVIPVVRRYELDIRRQVKYPDSLIAAYREDIIEPTRNSGTTSLFSLKQQAIVAEVKGSATYMDVKTGRPVDIRTLGGGWAKLFEGFTEKAEHAQMLKKKWDSEHLQVGKKIGSSKI
ncbi:uncharacterized protein N0V89_011482 [Didymosphaeria variabile]|uniref:Uncharacterized protein n=1 Tax=Didymosphaeria variabile TaxID=1932322 RepID=A0A9W8X9U5_9PLEO|nr:uncharacterized protein N0V89_011482 [Didymosphaeria variabile]KAJ4345352.1 hypothetical protein N0V89_011482 [Didymosphaeria variabile]